MQFKRLSIIIVGLLFFSNICVADGFDISIKETMDLMNQAKKSYQIKDCLTRFEKIAAANPNRWEAQYHHAYALLTYAIWEEGRNQTENINTAEKIIQKIIALKGEMSEIYVLQAYLYQAKIFLNKSIPNVISCGSKTNKFLEKAIETNPNNPRAYYQQGMMLYYAPAIFGGSKKKALVKFTIAKNKYEWELKNQKNQAFPNWGRDENLKMIKKCNS